MKRKRKAREVILLDPKIHVRNTIIKLDTDVKIEINQCHKINTSGIAQHM